MENQKFVVWTQAAAEVVKFKGFDDEGKKIGESMTLREAFYSEKWEVDNEDGHFCGSFKVIHPQWEYGTYTESSDVRLKYPDGDTLVDAFEVTFLMKPCGLNHPRNEHAWIKRIVLGGDTTLELSIPSDWPEDKLWSPFAHRKVSELKAGDELRYSGTAIDGKYGVNMPHTVQILGVSFLGKIKIEKLGIITLEITSNEDRKPIWLDGIPFTCPLSKDEVDEILRLWCGQED